MFRTHFQFISLKGKDGPENQSRISFFLVFAFSVCFSSGTILSSCLITVFFKRKFVPAFDIAVVSTMCFHALFFLRLALNWEIVWTDELSFYVLRLS